MTVAETIFEHVRMLPETDAKEVLDFIGFLESKHHRKKQKKDFSSIEYLKAVEETLTEWDTREDANACRDL